MTGSIVKSLENKKNEHKKKTHQMTDMKVRCQKVFSYCFGFLNVHYTRITQQRQTQTYFSFLKRASDKEPQYREEDDSPSSWPQAAPVLNIPTGPD